MNAPSKNRGKAKVSLFFKSYCVSIMEMIFFLIVFSLFKINYFKIYQSPHDTAFISRRIEQTKLLKGKLDWLFSVPNEKGR
jgi:hypothetical protein